MRLCMNPKTESCDRTENFRSRAVKYFAGFIIFMFFCTLISRGIYVYQMPQVTLGSMEQKSIVHEVEVTGNITAAVKRAVLTPEGMRVEEVCVRKGQDILPDTVLFRLNIEELTENMEEIEAEIALAEQRLKELEEEQRFRAQQRKKEAARAREDLENTIKDQDLLLQLAKQRYEEAQANLAAYPNFDVYYDLKIRQDSQYQTLSKDTEQKTDFQDYVSVLQLSLHDAWEEEKKVLENAVKETLGAYQTAQNDSNLAILQAKRNVEDCESETAVIKSGILEQQQSLQALQKKLKNCREAAGEEGRILSGIEGSVEEIRIGVGDRTPDTAAMVLADSTNGWIFEAVMDKDGMKYFNSQDLMSITLQKNNRKIKDFQVTAVQKTAEETYLITAVVEGENLSAGEMATLSFSKQEGPYACCVPLEAIHIAEDRSYLFVIREKDTILGKELRVVKRQVKVIDKNSSYAALEEGALGEEEQFVLDCNKELREGLTVRPKEL